MKDLFFSSDDFYHGFSNKTATVLVAQGIDAIRVGDSPTCRTPTPAGERTSWPLDDLDFLCSRRRRSVLLQAGISTTAPAASSLAPRESDGDTIGFATTVLSLFERMVWAGRLTNLGISGIADPSDASLPSNKWSAGAGIRVQKADTIRMENLDIR